MHSFIDCLLATCVLPVASRWWGEEAADGLVPSPVGASEALLEVDSRWCGLEAELGEVLEDELGEVSGGGVVVCAMTRAVGAMEIKAANKSVRRGLMKPLPILKSTQLETDGPMGQSDPSEPRVGGFLRERQCLGGAGLEGLYKRCQACNTRVPVESKV
jgi:hypothetical protein